MQAECQSLGMGQNFGSTFFRADKWPIGQRQTNHPSSGDSFPCSGSDQAPKAAPGQRAGAPQHAGRRLTQTALREAGLSTLTFPWEFWNELQAKGPPKSLLRVRMWELLRAETQFGDTERVKFLVFHFDPPDDDSNRNHKQQVPQKYSY